jgi:hypothetical protein
MKNNEELESNFQDTLVPELKSGITEISAVTKVGRQMRKIFYIVSLTGIGLCINACTSTGYVSTEPAYVEYSRPAQPSNLHVWINGDWVYNQQNHAYVQKNGYWEKPRHNREYMSGHWQTSPQGTYWVSGHYQRNRR